MLFTMVSTVDHGNFILYRCPHFRTYPDIDVEDPPADILVKITNHFSYFGLYPKHEALHTQQSVFSESCLLQTFVANQKRLESVLGIDEDCIFVNRGIFLNDHYRNFPKSSPSSIHNNYFYFEEMDEEKKFGVNSISLVWIAQQFSEVDALKHRLSFFLGSIERKQSSHNFMTKQIDKIIAAKNRLEVRIIDDWNNFLKENMVLEEQKIKGFIERCYDYVDHLIAEIEIFKELEKFHLCVTRGEEYEVTPYYGEWQGTMGSKFKVPNYETFTTKKKEKVDNKALLTIQKKMVTLPEVLYHDRVKRIVKKTISSENMQLKTLISQNRELQLLNVIHTVFFLIQNEFAVDIYPFNPETFLNIYSLHHLPNWETIRKFDKQIFQNSSLMQQLHKFSRYKKIMQLSQKDKYIILQHFVKEIEVFIYRIQLEKEVQEKKQQKMKGGSDEIENYSPPEQADDYIQSAESAFEIAEKRISINFYMAKNQGIQSLKGIINYVSKKKKERLQGKSNIEWGFYYVEKH